ncbi:MAG: VanZ family protein [Bryobacter sp.]|nr:VanZ family protein [Bryobacter sp.]
MPRPWLAFALALLFLSLYPWRFQFTQAPPSLSSLLSLTPPRTSGDWADSILNLLAYLPLGFLAAPRFAHRTLLLGFALSALVECLQVYLPGRHPSLRDLLLNTLGTALGLLLFRRLSVRFPQLSLSPVLLSAWALWLTAIALPFLPVLRRSQLRILFDSLLHPTLSLERTLDHALILAFLLQLTAFRYTLPIAALALLYSGFVYKLRFDYSLLLALLLAPALQRLSPRWLAVLWLPWLAWKQFHFYPGQPLPASFAFIPFAGLAADPLLILRTLSTKALLYGGAIFTLLRSRIPALHAFSSVSLLLACGEWAQLSLPGRTPESTDPLLALLFGWWFWKGPPQVSPQAAPHT